MLDLTKTFNKFYPRSQTVSKGVFLIKLAWAVEIIVALIGLLIGVIVVLRAQGYETTGAVSAIDPTLDDLLFGLIFVIVAIVEITKIPLATAVYFAAKLSWRVIFLIALLLVNVSTFETIVTGFERISRARTATISDLLVKKSGIEKIIYNKRSNIDENIIQKDIDSLVNQKNKILEQINEIESRAINQKNKLKDQSANIGEIEGLKREIQTFSDEIKSLRDANIPLNDQLSKQKLFSLNRGRLQKNIEQNNKKIDELEKKRGEASEQLKQAQNTAQRGNQSQIGAIDQERKSNKLPLDQALAQIEASYKISMDRKKNLSEKGIIADKEIKDHEDELRSIVMKIDDSAPDNQVFRVALWFKGFFKVDYEDEIKIVEEKISDLAKSKINPKKWIFFDKKLTETEINNIDQEILRLEQRRNNLILRKEYEDKTNRIQSVYADLPEGALTMAFWAWFGVLSFIISVTGTMLAFAGLNLQDPRMHDIRAKKTAGWKGVSGRASTMFVLINKYIWGKIKRLKDPKIVEKEVEVEKIVEKIVEKPVGQKIVYEKVEVPKEVIRKELVYVPLPTDDTEVLKKGPFSVPEDKTKK